MIDTIQHGIMSGMYGASVVIGFMTLFIGGVLLFGAIVSIFQGLFK